MDGYSGVIRNASILAVNCLFKGSSNGWYTGSTSLKGEARNSASVNTYMDPYSGSKNNCLYNVTIDSDYNITSDGWKNAGIGTNPDGTQANIGVYGGDYSW